MPSLRLHSSIKDDTDRAVAYYSDFDSRLGQKFIDDFSNRLDTVFIFPEGIVEYKIIQTFSIRRINLSGFPYAIFYHYDRVKCTIFVFTVTQAQQDPDTIEKMINHRSLFE